MHRFLPPFLLAALTVVTAPFLGEVRDLLFDHFGGSAVKILAVVLGALALVIAVMAILRIVAADDRRGLRLVLASVAAVVIVGQVFGFGTADPETDIVEKVHIVQYGLLAFLFHRALAGAQRARDEHDIAGPTRLVLPILWASIVGLLDESTQGFFQMRTGDIRDVAINALSSVSGLLLALALDPPRGFRWRPSANGLRRLADWTAILVLGTGLFIAELHLGTWIHDPQIGRFRSWFTPEQLRELAADRTRRWAQDPPTDLVPWKPEDYFLTEAAWHASHRNERYRAGDFTLARQANRILETYYGPFLDLQSFRGSGVHRYPPAVLRQLDQNALPIDPSGYESPVLAQRLHTWPPAGPFRLVVSIVAALIVTLPRLRRRDQNP